MRRTVRWLPLLGALLMLPAMPVRGEPDPPEPDGEETPAPGQPESPTPDQPESPPDQTDEAKAPRRVAVAVFLLPHPDVEDRHAEKLSRSLEKALGQNHRLGVKDSSKLLADFAGEVPKPAIQQARELFEQGLQAMLELDSPGAIKKLTKAVEALEAVLPFVRKSELADAMMALGVAHLTAGDTKTAEKMFTKLLTWREHLRYDTRKYPPKFLSAFEDAKRGLKRRRRGSVELVSEPDGARAYVDGRFVGVTPTYAEGLLIGDHYVTLKKKGFHKLVMRVTVHPKREGTFRGVLKRSKKYKLVNDSLKRAQEGVEREEADPGMVDLKAFLFIDQAIFVRLSPKATKIHVDAYLFDLRSKRRLSLIRRDLVVEEVDKVGEELAKALYLNVPYDGALVAPPEEAPPPPITRRPFYKTWWFWTAVGVTVTTVIVVPAALAPGDSARAPEPFHRVDVQLF